VEALALIDSPRAQAALKKALRHNDLRVRTAVLDYAPHLVSDDERTSALVTALQSADFYEGLTQALDHVEEFHPTEVIDALFRGVLNRAGDVAVHFAAMLMFLHGKAREAFDWEQRPFFLEFNTDDGAERRKRFRELCEKIGVNADEMTGRFNN
jgi:HEAT repeat protein